MSKQSLQAFLDKAKRDSRLKGELAEIGSPAEVISLGKRFGYDFNRQDLEQATKEKMQSGQLKQADLENVSGGTILTPVTIIVMTISVCGRAA